MWNVHRPGYMHAYINQCKNTELSQSTNEKKNKEKAEDRGVLKVYV